MSLLFSYSLAVSVSLLLCLIAYRISLTSAINFSACRLTIIAIYLTSLLLPFCLSFLTRNNPDAIVNLPIQTNISEPRESVIWRYLLIAWSVGCGMSLILSILSLVRIFQIVLKAEKSYINGHTIYVTNNTRIAPFSFGKIVVINRNDIENHTEIIISHEQGHVHYHHTLDMLLSQVVIVLCWYNPAAWLLRKDLKTVHEFQADRYVLDNGNDMQDYQLFLVKRAARSSFPVIGNNLTKNRLKKRFLMMQKTTKYGQDSSLGYFSPVIALILAGLLLNIPEVSGALRESAETHLYERHVDVKKGVVITIGGDNGRSDNDIIYELDGRAVSQEDLKGLSPDRIGDISVIKSGEKAIICIILRK